MWGWGWEWMHCVEIAEDFQSEQGSGAYSTFSDQGLNLLRKVSRNRTESGITWCSLRYSIYTTE
jgi:hypothetical protein